MKNYKLRVVLAGMIGNSLEFCDFAIYSFFAPIIASLFFPDSDAIIPILKGLGVYAVGFIMRPAGGILFGYIGDKYGRKRALVSSIGLMSAATLMMGMLPTYQSIGIWAPVLLILCRMFQGLSTGGEYNGAVIYVLEHYMQSKKGLAAGMIYASSYIGFILASCICILSMYVPHPESWRFPFVLGFILGGVGLYIRIKLQESPEFLEYISQAKTQKKESAPLKILFTNYRVPFFKALSAAGVTGIFSIITLTYVSTHLITFTKWPKPQAMFIVTISSALSAILSPLYGMLADRMKIEKLMVWGALSSLLICYPFAKALQTTQFNNVLFWQLLWVVSSMLFMTPMNLFIVNQFSVNIRYLGSAVSYSLGMAFLGGTTPILMTALTNGGWYPESLIAWVFLATGLAIVATREKKVYATS